MKIQSIYSPTFRPSCRTICLVLAVFVAIVIARPARSQSAKDAASRAQAAALFAKALSVSDLRAPGSPPFEMHGAISIEQGRHKPSVTGTYLLKWASPDQWREEIHFANYTRIRVGGKNQYWQSRTTANETESILQLSRGLDFLKTLHAWSKPASIGSLKHVQLHREKEHGAKLDCATLTWKNLGDRGDYCFESTVGALVTSGTDQSEFSDFIVFEGKRFPGNIRTQEESSFPVALQVTSITSLVHTESTDFQPLAGAPAWPECEDPDALPFVKSEVFPSYPTYAVLTHRDGDVLLYVVIGIDGQLHDLRVLSTPDSVLADSALTALKQWRYTPETCSGNPVPVEMLVKVTYALAF